MSIANGSFRSEIALRTVAAAKMFFPPLMLSIGFSILLVLISLAHPIFLRVGDYQFPILIPYFENLTKMGCYIVACVAFFSLFVSLTFRDYAMRFSKMRTRLKRSALDVAKSSSTARSQGADDRRLLEDEIRINWKLAQVERRLRDLEYEQNRFDTEVEPITDFEALEILIPVLCAMIFLLLLLWPIILITTLVAVTILAISGTLRLALTRIADFVFRLVFKGAFRL